MFVELLTTNSTEIIPIRDHMCFSKIDGRLSLPNSLEQAQKFYIDSCRYITYCVGFALYRSNIRKTELLITYVEDQYIDIPLSVCSETDKQKLKRGNYRYFNSANIIVSTRNITGE